MSNTLSGDDVKFLYSTDGAYYEYLNGVEGYKFGIDCKSKDYQPALQPYTFTAKLSQKVALTLDFLEHTNLVLPDPCHIMIALFFADDIIWVRRAKFQQLDTNLTRSPASINNRSQQFSLVSSLDSYITNSLNLAGQIDLIWEPISYSPPPTYDLFWEPITVIV